MRLWLGLRAHSLILIHILELRRLTSAHRLLLLGFVVIIVQISLRLLLNVEICAIRVLSFELSRWWALNFARRWLLLYKFVSWRCDISLWWTLLLLLMLHRCSVLLRRWSLDFTSSPRGRHIAKVLLIFVWICRLYRKKLVSMFESDY